VKKSVPELDQEKCTGCGDCVEQCPVNAVELIADKAAITRPEACNYCTECETLCPSGAIRCSFEIILVKEEPEISYKEGRRSKGNE